MVVLKRKGGVAVADEREEKREGVFLCKWVQRLVHVVTVWAHKRKAVEATATGRDILKKNRLGVLLIMGPGFSFGFHGVVSSLFTSSSSSSSSNCSSIVVALCRCYDMGSRAVETSFELFFFRTASQKAFS